MENISPEYNKQLKDLAHLLCPLKAVVEINPLSIPRDEYEYHPFQHDIEDTNTGFDSEGNYHHPSLRTEHVK